MMRWISAWPRLARGSVAILLGWLLVAPLVASPVARGASDASYDYIRFDGTVYAVVDRPIGRELNEDDLGPEVAQVEALDDSGIDPCYRSFDNNAGELAPGTTVYEVNGYDPSFRLAVVSDDGRIVLYEATCSFSAQQASDILDLQGRVLCIGAHAPERSLPELGAIRDEAEIERLVDLVLDAPIAFDPELVGDPSRADPRYWIVFYLNDATTTAPRAFWPEDGELAYGIIVPEEFSQAIAEAIDLRANAPDEAPSCRLSGN